MKRILSCLFLLLIAPTVFAGIFDPPPTDQSVNLLGVIFGSNVGDIPLGGVANPVLSDMMEKFNFIIVVVGLVVVSYVGILSVINTAHEGTAMGKKWSAVWIPMRSVAGMALMVPAPESGYSMIQVTVMWIILQGIGAADALWNIALDGLASGASVSGGTFVDPTLFDTGKALAKELLNAQTCMSTMYKLALTPENANANNGNGNWMSQHGQLVNDFMLVDKAAAITTPPSSSYCKPNSKFASVKYAEMIGTYYFGVDDPQDASARNICGAISIIGSACTTDYKNSNVLPSDNDLIKAAEEVYYNKVNAISSMLTGMQNLAEGFASGDFIQPLGTESTLKPPPPGFIQAAATAFQNLLSGVLVTPPGGAQNASGLSSDLQKTITLGKQNGWITAGSFYFIFNQTRSGNIFQSVSAQKMADKGGTSAPTIPACPGTVAGTSPSSCSNGFPQGSSAKTSLQAAGVSSDNDLKTLAKNLGMSAAYAAADTQPAGGMIFTAPGAASGAAADALSAATSFNSQAISDMSNLLKSNSGDPLLNIAAFGKSIMLGVEASFLSVISIALLTAVGSMFPSTFSFMGTSLGIPDLGKYASTAALIIIGIYALLLPVFTMMWSFGAMLAVYCPLIPFMIFTMAVLGWMLTVVEAIIAAPIVALGIILPSGDDIGELKPALTILANIFLRPMLMIFGFLIAGRVYKAIVMLINFGMGSVFDSINVSTMFSTLVVIAVYATFIMTITNTCFSLIYAVPDKILRWIGAHGETTDVGAVSEAKGAAQRAGGEVSKGMSEGGSFAGGKAAEKLGGFAGGKMKGIGKGLADHMLKRPDKGE